MRVAIITDQHFGARNDSVAFLDYYENFYSKVFFPTLFENGITTVLILGDTFDRRKYINFQSLKRTKKMFFDELSARGMDVYMLIGNHDTYFKNTNAVNSVELMLGEYENLNIIPNPTTMVIDGTQICFIPWICDDNYQAAMDEMKNTEAQICCGHFEIAGFAMYRGARPEDGLPRELFRKFELTMSGHYHYKSDSNGIHYLGNPYQLTWQDYGDVRGFHILDLNSRELTFIANPFEMFVKLIYNDKTTEVTDIVNHDMSPYKDKYIKVIVTNKSNPYLFDMFMNNLYAVNPADVNIVEDFTDITEGVEEIMIDQAEDTMTIINKVVDNMETDLNKERIKGMMKELYVEALNLEQA